MQITKQSQIRYLTMPQFSAALLWVSVGICLDVKSVLHFEYMPFSHCLFLYITCMCKYDVIHITGSA